MKKAGTKEMVLVLMVICFLCGCAEKGKQKNTVETKPRGFKGVPVELQVQSDEGIPVSVKAKEEIPVKVQMQENDGKPVRVAIQSTGDLPLKLDIESNKSMPVKLDMEGDEGLPVEIKLPRVALVYIAIAAGAILLIAIFTCFSAIGAARSAKAACQSADAIKKVLQQSKPDLHATKKNLATK